MKKFAVPAIAILVLAVIGWILGQLGVYTPSGYQIQSIKIEGSEYQVFASTTKVDLARPITFVVPGTANDQTPFTFINEGCTCFSMSDNRGSVSCKTGESTTPGMTLAVACQGESGIRMERYLDPPVTPTSAQ